MKELVRKIFSQFKDLNLVFLMEDLRLGLVAHKNWVDCETRLMCPLQHGFDVYSTDCMSVFKYLGNYFHLAAEDVISFVNIWDARSHCISLSSETLLSYLEEIWKERMEDAEAVQEVITEKEFVEV